MVTAQGRKRVRYYPKYYPKSKYYPKRFTVKTGQNLKRFINNNKKIHVYMNHVWGKLSAGTLK